MPRAAMDQVACIHEATTTIKSNYCAPHAPQGKGNGLWSN